MVRKCILTHEVYFVLFKLERKILHELLLRVNNFVPLASEFVLSIIVLSMKSFYFIHKCSYGSLPKGYFIKRLETTFKKTKNIIKALFILFIRIIVNASVVLLTMKMLMNNKNFLVRLFIC